MFNPNKILKKNNSLKNSDSAKMVYYDTGVYLLNLMYGGSMFSGIPSKVTTVASPPGVGKSLIAYTMCKTFLSENKNNIVYLYDTESAVDADMLINIIGEENSERLIYKGSEENINVIEIFTDEISKDLDDIEEEIGNGKIKKSNVMMILDSIAAFTSEEVVNLIKSKEVNKAQWIVPSIITKLFPIIVNRMNDLKIPFFITTHMKPKLMATQWEDKWTIVGAQALKFFCTNIYRMTKVKHKDDSESNTVARCRPEKSRKNKTTFKFDIVINFTKAIERNSGLIDVLKNEGLVEGNKLIVGKKFLNGFKEKRKIIEEKGLDTLIGNDLMIKINKFLQAKYNLGYKEGDEEIIREVSEKTIHDMKKDELLEYIKENGLDINIKKAKLLAKTKLISKIEKVEQDLSNVE